MQKKQITTTYLEGKCSLVKKTVGTGAVGVCPDLHLRSIHVKESMLLWFTRRIFDNLEEAKFHDSNDKTAAETRWHVLRGIRHTMNQPPLDVRHCTAVTRQSYVVSD